MIKYWVGFFGTIALIIILNNGNAQQITYHIAGKVGQYSAPAKAYLRYQNGTNIRVDSAEIAKGTFAFAGTSDQPEVATIFINTKGSGFMAYDAGYLNLYLEKGQISIVSDELQNAKISGGPLNKDFDELKMALKETEVKLDKVNDLYSNATPEKQKLTAFKDSIITESFKVMEEQKLVGLSFLKNHPSSLVSLTALDFYGGIHPDSRLTGPVFNLLTAEVRLSKAGLMRSAQIAKMNKTAVEAYYLASYC